MQVEPVTMLLAERARPLRGPPGWDPVETLIASVVETPAPGVVRLQAGGKTYQARPGFDLRPGAEVRIRISRRGGAVRLEVQAPAGTVRTSPAANAARRLLSAQQPLSHLTTRLAALARRRDIPPVLRRALDRVVAHTATASRLRQPREMLALIKRSGIWLEARLATAAGHTDTAAPPPGEDLKSALLQLAATLEALAPPAGATAPHPREAPGSEPVPPPFPYRLPAAEGRRVSSMRDASTPTLTRQLHQDVHAALARLSMHQLASLNADAALPFWSLEIPVAHRDGAETIGLTIERDREGGDDAAASTCTVTVAMEPAGLGPVWARLTWRGNGQLGGVFYAGNETGRGRLEAALPRLRDQLARRGLKAGTLACRAGMPPAGERPAPHRMLDVRA